MSKFPYMVEYLGAEIDRRTVELEEMKSLYLSIGGVLVEEEIEVPDVEPVKRLTGPKAKGATEQAVRKPRDAAGLVDYIVYGHTLTTSPRKKQVIEKLWSCRGVPVSADELVGFYGGKKELLYAEITAIKKYLAPFGITIINERGLGFRMETF